MSSLTISISADVEREGAARLISARWEDPENFLMDISLPRQSDGGVVIILSREDAQRVLRALESGGGA